MGAPPTKRWFTLGVLLLGAAGSLLAPTTLSATGTASATTFDQSHAVLNGLLAAYVTDGRVDYVGLNQNRDQLQAYLVALGSLSDLVFRKEFSRTQQLALLINAYNAFTLELILHNYPVASIQDIPGNWTEAKWLLLGRKTNLNDLENKLIRPRFGEPRIHFALVCAANGCPPLRAEAYVADRLDDQLAAATRGYARNQRFNRLDKTTATLYVSKIFEWYEEDFVAGWGDSKLPRDHIDSPGHHGVVGFFLAQLEEDEANFLTTMPVKIQYLDYDWGLNEIHTD